MAKRNSRVLIGIVLLIAAGLFVFLAFQCVTTVEYGLYETNYSYYIEKAAESAAKAQEYETLATGTYGEQYSLMARNMLSNAESWKDSAKSAQSYLTWHRIGFGSLIVVAVLSLIAGIRFFLPAKKKETPAEPTTEGNEASNESK